MRKLYLFFILTCWAATALAQDAAPADSVDIETVSIEIEKIEFAPITSAEVANASVPELVPATVAPGALAPVRHGWVSPYALPYSTHCTGGQNWHRMWINTAVLSGAFIGTLFVLELLPEDATAWNRASIQQTPMFKRWYRNIFVLNPEWDHDKFYFNYILHPYAGAAYFMAARSCGFSFWGSMLYSAAISTIGWEFGIEAFMERPSYQDIFITPVIGSLFGELMYKGKRAIVDRGYELLGSWFLGRAACFLLDPVNEVIDLFRGNPAKVASHSRRRMSGSFGFSPHSVALTINF